MTVEVSRIGEVGGADVSSFRIDNGILRLEAWDFGATLVALELPDNSGGWINCVLRHEELVGYTDRHDRAGYLGATVGRYANRIADSRFVLDDQAFALTANEGPNHLHGGQVGFDQLLWTAVGAGDDHVTFTLVSADGDQGYPGRLSLTASVRYRLDGATLHIEHEARTDSPTVVNLTNHAYWNLARRGTIGEHEIVLRANKWLAVDEASIPTGVVERVEGTRFDLRRATRLADVVTDGGVDRCFLLDYGTRVREVATLLHAPTGRSMVVATDQPALQLYTANYLEPPYTAVCLETQRPPNAPNDPRQGPSVLRPRETYQHRTTYTFRGPGIPGRRRNETTA